MKNGDFLQLEEGSLTTLAELADGLEVPERNLEQGHLQVPVYQAYYVDQVLREGGERLTVQRDLNFRSMIRTLKYYEDSDDEVPAGLTTTLRQYQQTGYQWLMTLTRMGLGGILADDMGLGKTVQVITMLFSPSGEAVAETGSDYYASFLWCITGRVKFIASRQL